MHKIKEPFERMLFRSYDGGQTWQQSNPTTRSGTRVTFDGEFSGVAPPKFNLDKPDTIIRACGVYDTGGDYTNERGCFYLSEDRGKHWDDNPYDFVGIDLPDDQQLTARTCTVGNLVFLSAGSKEIWGTDYTFVARHDGKKFTKIGTVCEDSARAVMPAAVRMGEGLFCVLRRWQGGKRAGWIDSFMSYNEGQTWIYLGYVDDTGSHNGNPPALIVQGDTLLCVYGNRDNGEMRGARWSGKRWETFLLRASESDNSVDVGYPRLFLRGNGRAVCVYYWTSDQRPQQHIAWSVL
jgi:hypothetical protein